mmetsp:Transcript_68706/g.201126  ORF Transcript_68706/g.201126 Transcript_68706/m.201126 type:complete len:418 (-) Transcript_68706:198-1451(-)
MAAEVTVLDIDSDVEEVEGGFEVDVTEELKDEIDLEGEEDPERIPKETEPYPALHPPVKANLSGAAAKAAAKTRQDTEKDAAALVEEGNVPGAIQLYTEAMRSGGATAMMLATRAALLLRQRRPCACVRDCTAALRINGSMVKAYRVRAAAQRRLGHWRKAHHDLLEAQGLKFDTSTAELQRFVSAQVLKLDIAAERRAQGGGATSSPAAPAAAPEPPAPAKPEASKEPMKDLDKGQAVVLTGLQKAPHLNDKRGVVERRDPRPAAQGRWEVELRMGGGCLEVKSLKRENIMTLNKADKAACRAWAAEEKKHREERRQREEKEELAQYHRCVDSTMVKLPLSDTTRALLRQLHPKEALEIMDKAGDKNVVSNVEDFVAARAKLYLGQSDSDEEEPPVNPEAPFDPEEMPAKRARAAK